VGQAVLHGVFGRGLNDILEEKDSRAFVGDGWDFLDMSSSGKMGARKSIRVAEGIVPLFENNRE
jgi:hypothetical protein